MKKHSFAGCTAAVSLMLLSLATMMAQTPAADPWTRVPAAPTSCYSGDDYEAKVTAVITALDTEIARQDKINDALQQQVKSLSPAEMMQRMQAYMMKNPQEAQKVIAAMTGSAQTGADTIVASQPELDRLDKELANKTSAFNAAVDAGQKPLQTKVSEMVSTKTDAVGEGGGFRFKTAALQAEYLGLVQQENTEYEKVCSSYFGAAGEFTKWLASYKTYLINGVITPTESVANAGALQLQIFSTPTAEYRSTAKLEGVRTYLQKARAVYALRKARRVPHQEYTPLGR